MKADGQPRPKTPFFQNHPHLKRIIVGLSLAVVLLVGLLVGYLQYTQNQEVAQQNQDPTIISTLTPGKGNLVGKILGLQNGQLFAIDPNNGKANQVAVPETNHIVAVTVNPNNSKLLLINRTLNEISEPSYKLQYLDLMSGKIQTISSSQASESAKISIFSEDAFIPSAYWVNDDVFHYSTYLPAVPPKVSQEMTEIDPETNPFTPAKVVFYSYDTKTNKSVDLLTIGVRNELLTSHPPLPLASSSRFHAYLNSNNQIEVFPKAGQDNLQLSLLSPENDSVIKVFQAQPTGHTISKNNAVIWTEADQLKWLKAEEGDVQSKKLLNIPSSMIASSNGEYLALIKMINAGLSIDVLAGEEKNQKYSSTIASPLAMVLEPQASSSSVTENNTEAISSSTRGIVLSNDGKLASLSSKEFRDEKMDAYVQEVIFIHSADDSGTNIKEVIIPNSLKNMHLVGWL